ncbi:MAG: response regulator, partial [Spirochaetales bacterium]|nr:response regulator [Spirochaetales bacterium]
MKAKALVLSANELVSRLISTAALQLEIDITYWDNKENIFKVISDKKYDILFIDESILNANGKGLILKIRDLDSIDNLFIVVSSTNNNFSRMTQDLGADAFLPIPFSKMKFNSLFRGILDQSRVILMVSNPVSEVTDFALSLTDKGYEVVQAYTGDECMILTHRHFPDLIISELKLADMSGIDLIRKIKKTNLASRIPVLILTDESSAEMIEECFNSGARDVILKPYNTESNITKITTTVAPVKKGRKEKALIIDDSLFVRNMISKMFKKLGFEVVDADNGLNG